MTAQSPPDRAVPPASRPELRAARTDAPSVHVQRARRLLRGGLVGGSVAGLLCLLGFGLALGGRGLLSAALATAMVLFFYGQGQYVMVLFADAGARTLLAVALCSYTLRVAVLGLLLLVVHRFGPAWSALVPNVVFLTTVAVVVGWLAVEVWVFSRLRVAAYDSEYVPPSEQSVAP